MKNEKKNGTINEQQLESLQAATYSGEIEQAISEHNQSSVAHQDIRDALGVVESSLITPVYADLVLNVPISNAANGLLKFEVAGKSRVFLDDDIVNNNPWQVGKNRHLMYTSGKVSVVDGEKTQTIDVNLYEVGEVLVFGQTAQTRGTIINGVSDILTENALTRNVSNKLYFNRSWNWVQIGTTTNRITYGCKIPKDDFIQLPYEYAPNQICLMNSDFGFNKSYNDVLLHDHTYVSVGLICYGMHYDQTDSTYNLAVSVYKTINSVDSFKAAIVDLLKTWIVYRLKTPVIDKISNKIASNKNIICSWIQNEVIENNNSNNPVNIALPYKSIYYQAPINTAASTNNQPIVENINELNYQIRNVSAQEAKLGVPDGITDNAGLFQSTIIQLSMEGKNVINLGSGKFVVSSTLCLPANFILNGNGATELIFTSPGHCIEVQGSNVQITNIKLTQTVKNTTETGIIYLNGYYYPTNILIDNVFIKGSISENKTNPLNYYYNNYDDKTCGIYAYNNTRGGYAGYINYIVVKNTTIKNLYCGVYNQATPADIDVICDYVRYAVKALTLFGKYRINMHCRSMPNADKDNKTEQIYLNESVVYVSSRYNNFDLTAFDSQRTRHIYEFTENSQFNTYTGADNYIANIQYLNMWFDDYDGVYKTYPHTYYIVKDKGYANTNLDTTRPYVKPFVGSTYRNAFTDPNTPGGSMAEFYGMQDNALANISIWGAITCKDKNGNDISTSKPIADICAVGDGTHNYNAGVTILKTPAEDDPIIIELDLTSNSILNNKLGIFWSIVPKSFKIFTKEPGGQYTERNIGNSDNVNFHYWINEKFATTQIEKIKIEIYQTNVSDTYNTQGQIGIYTIYATDARRGGRAWQSRHSNGLLTNAKDIEGAINELYEMLSTISQ